MSKKLIYLFVLVVFSASTAFAASNVTTTKTEETTLNLKIDKIKVGIKDIYMGTERRNVAVTSEEADTFILSLQGAVVNFQRSLQLPEFTLTVEEYYKATVLPILEREDLTGIDELESLITTWIKTAMKLPVKLENCNTRM